TMRSKNRSTQLLIAFLSLVCLGVTAMAQENPFLGKWDITGVGQQSNYVYWLEVKDDNGKLSGNFLNLSGSVLPLAEIRIEGGELVFAPTLPRPTMPKSVHRAKVEEGRLLGMVTIGEGENAQNIAWIGERPPKWPEFNANKKYKFGLPVMLFDGKTME